MLALLLPAAATKSDGELLRAFQATFSNGAAVLGWPATGEPCTGIKSGMSSWGNIECSDDRVLEM